jgi:hypothetical protein
MNKSFILIFVAVFGLIACRQEVAPPEKNRLQFNNEGKFKIAQFTDLHYINGSPNSAATTETIQYVLETEKPDVAILTGDIVYANPSKDVWPQIAQIFEEAKTPFAVVFGNHDPETITRDSVFDILSHSPYFIGEKGPADIGVGNYLLPIYGLHSNKPEWLIFCFDSNDYLAYQKYYYYDYIHFNQNQWYREQSKKFAQANDNRPVPSLAFFHIPLQEIEYVAKNPNTVGNVNEEYAYAKINSGLFASFVERGDVIGIFTGHDHDNDFIGLENGIAMAYGRVGGADAYGSLERGGRIIELDESQPGTFTTWIRTPTKEEFAYYYPSGITKQQEDTATYLPAQNVNPVTQGVNYTYYEGNFQSVNEIAAAKPLKSGVLKSFSLADAMVDDHFAFVFHSWIKIPEKGVYYFYTFTDDGSRLLIDGVPVVNNDGSHSAEWSIGSIALQAGFHDLKVLYFDDYESQKIEVGWYSRKITQSVIPDDRLFIPEK